MPSAPAGQPDGSYVSLADGMADVFDALIERDPEIALEPTCFRPHLSPWWIKHVPYHIGAFGGDSPDGYVPCPDWQEAMTTGRDIANLRRRDDFLLPSSAVQCFDIVVQSPGRFQNSWRFPASA